MKLIVISETRYFPGEEDLVNAMFDAGLQIFHLRRARSSNRSMREFLDKINPKYYSRIMIHSHHELAPAYKLKGIHISDKKRTDNFIYAWLKTKYLKIKAPSLNISTSFHDLGTLMKSKTEYSYVFLSPIFDSISKVGYSNKFNEEALLNTLKKSPYKIIAMGGVDEKHIQQVKDMGFAGCAFLGAIWTDPEPLDKFKSIKKLCAEVFQVS